AREAEESAAPRPNVEYRSLIEVHRQLIAAVAVDNRAGHVGNDAAHDAAAREERVRRLHCDAGSEVVIREDAGRGAFHDERAALLHELVEIYQPFHAHAATNV